MAATDKTFASMTCKGCTHFYVTYDPHFPYGCRGLGFKSRRSPCLDVIDASGAPCQMRQDKPAERGR